MTVTRLLEIAYFSRTDNQSILGMEDPVDLWDEIVKLLDKYGFTVEGGGDTLEVPSEVGKV
jgi:hypothetical protein